jgi:cytidylate kinase
VSPPGRLVIAVDGPGGSGKSTVSREVARRLGLAHLDTGAFYRAATLAGLRTRIDLSDEAALVAIVDRIVIDQENGRTYLDGEDVSGEIRSDEVTASVSAVAAHPSVRQRLVARQRAWVGRHGHRAAVEGRDIGSVVFPDAQVKVFLTADPAERARRRARELGAREYQVEVNLARRDRIDSSREASPLAVAEGAVILDTTGMTFEEVVERVLELAR